jgi:hypothetical protein
MADLYLSICTQFIQNSCEIYVADIAMESWVRFQHPLAQLIRGAGGRKSRITHIKRKQSKKSPFFRYDSLRKDSRTDIVY